jgi:hypothetical protein
MTAAISANRIRFTLLIREARGREGIKRGPKVFLFNAAAAVYAGNHFQRFSINSDKEKRERSQRRLNGAGVFDILSLQRFVQGNG